MKNPRRVSPGPVASAKASFDREALYATWRNIHPGVPQHERIDLILTALVDELANQIEGKHGD